MKVTVTYFAMARDLAGRQTEVIEMTGSPTSDDLLDHLVLRYPLLAPWKPYVRLAVNRQYSSGATQLQDGDTVAMIPPVSGG